MKKVNLKFPWVFFIRIEKRKWFKKVWISRCSNSMDIQFFGIHILTGLPWLNNVLNKADSNHPLEGLNHFITTNKTFSKWYHIHINKNYKL